MKKYISLLLCLFLISSLFLAGCTKKQKEEEVIKIGAILPLTGTASSTGIFFKEAMEAAVDDAKKEGLNVELIIEDSQTDPKQAVSTFNKLTDVDNIKIIYTLLSSHGMVLKPLAEEKKVFMWVDNSHPDQVKDSNFIMRRWPNAEYGAQLFADFINKNQHKKVGIVYQVDEWGVAYNNALVQLLKNFGIESYSEGINNKDSDFRTSLLKIKNYNPDAIMFIVYGPAAGLTVKQIRELGYKGTLYSDAFVNSPGADKIAGDAAKGMYVAVFEPSEEALNYLEKKLGKKPEPVSQIIVYTNMEFILYGIKKIKSDDPQKLVNFLKNIGKYNGKLESFTVPKSGDIPTHLEIKVWEEAIG